MRNRFIPGTSRFQVVGESGGETGSYPDTRTSDDFGYDNLKCQYMKDCLMDLFRIQSCGSFVSFIKKGLDLNFHLRQSTTFASKSKYFLYSFAYI